MQVLIQCCWDGLGDSALWTPSQATLMLYRDHVLSSIVLLLYFTSSAWLTQSLDWLLAQQEAQERYPFLSSSSLSYSLCHSIHIWFLSHLLHHPLSLICLICVIPDPWPHCPVSHSSSWLDIQGLSCLWFTACVWTLAERPSLALGFLNLECLRNILSNLEDLN